MTWGLGGEGQAWGGWRLALVFLFLFGWTAYSTEICATFSPEYKDPERDTAIALKVAGLLTLAAALVVPLGLGGTVGDAAIAENTGGMYAAAFDKIVGPASGLVTLLVCGALYLVMNSCTADAGRALFGIAKDKLTIKQLDQLNSKGVPEPRHGLRPRDQRAHDPADRQSARASSSPRTSATSRRSCWRWPASSCCGATGPTGPGRSGSATTGSSIATVLCVYNIGLLIIGTFYPGDAGYGGTRGAAHRSRHPRLVVRPVLHPAGHPGSRRAALARGDAARAVGGGTAAARRAHLAGSRSESRADGEALGRRAFLGPRLRVGSRLVPDRAPSRSCARC